MSRFKKDNSRATPGISTASLPDIVFMLLFFFMVSTVMREQELKVQMKYPKATELKKLENRSLVSTIYVGPPAKNLEGTFGTAPRVQLNDVVANDVKEVRQFINDERAGKPENKQNKMTTSLKVHQDVKMGTVTEVKQELRKVGALKVNYSAVPNVSAMRDK